MSDEDIVFGGVEGGGTNFVMLIGTGPNRVIDEHKIRTTTPDDTLEQVVEFLRRPRPGVTLGAVGLSSFGPVDLDPTSSTYGYITTTPKESWPNTPIVPILREKLGLPIGFDTDTNGAALGERRWGAGDGYDPLLYVTVGTGIGGGVSIGDHLLHGLLHPEVGHLPMPVFEGDEFAGSCPFHGRCLEGLASGPAIKARTGRPAEDIDADDPVWESVAYYLACGLTSMMLTVSPQRIIVGGGVATVPGLLMRVRARMLHINNGYIDKPEMTEQGIAEYVVPPGIQLRSPESGEMVNRSGAIGAIELARRAYDAARQDPGVKAI